MARKRVDVRAILADADLRRELMVSTIQTTQTREGIETTRAQADRAYYVVKEADNAVFFDLERHRGGKRSDPDRRREMFVLALRERADRVRFDVARRDFKSIQAAPLNYLETKITSRIFRDFVPISHAFAEVTSGLMTVQSERIVRQRWELPKERVNFLRGWSPFAKGGDFSRFYRDIDLVVDLGPKALPLLESEGCLRNRKLYGREGLTWVPRTQRGFNVQHLPPRTVFGKKGPIILPKKPEELWAILALLNSSSVEYLTLSITSFGSYEVGAVSKLPLPHARADSLRALGAWAEVLHDKKAEWDAGNEISTRFNHPWLVAHAGKQATIPDMLSAVAEWEAGEEARIQTLYAELNDEVYKLYGINAQTRNIIEETLGERPPEILWPQMEGKTKDQKRMEHVSRLLSYAVKRVVEADADGIVPLIAISGETALVDRVRDELAALFPDQDAYQLEVDIGNELRRKVKGYRSVDGIDEWLRDCYFDYHVSLYKKRPIFWHIASRPGRGDCAFGALVHYHRFDQNRLAKLRGSYLRDAIALFRREAGLADKDGRIEDRQESQARLEEAEAINERLRWVQEGINGPPAPGDCRIRTPWKSDDELPDGWQPDLDDGVAVNIRPLQTAGVLRVEAVV